MLLQHIGHSTKNELIADLKLLVFFGGYGFSNRGAKPPRALIFPACCCCIHPLEEGWLLKKAHIHVHPTEKFIIPFSSKGKKLLLQNSLYQADSSGEKVNPIKTWKKGGEIKW